MHRRCKVADCRAQVWHGDLCNYHTLLRVRASEAQLRSIGKVSETRAKVQRDAAALGIVLAETQPAQEPALVHSQSAPRGKKVRSPVS